MGRSKYDHVIEEKELDRVYEQRKKHLDKREILKRKFGHGIIKIYNAFLKQKLKEDPDYFNSGCPKSASDTSKKFPTTNLFEKGKTEGSSSKYKIDTSEMSYLNFRKAFVEQNYEEWVPALLKSYDDFMAHYLKQISKAKTKYWYLYYLHLHGRKDHKNLMIVRAVIKVQQSDEVEETKDKEDNKIWTFNPKIDSTFHDYEGSYIKNKNQIFSFDLSNVKTADKKDENHHSLHFKVHSPNSSDDLAVGQYIVNDGLKVYSGACVMQRFATSLDVKDEKEEKKLIAPKVFLPYGMSKDQFEGVTSEMLLPEEIKVPAFIERYLCEKRMNLRRLPLSIHDEPTLIRFLEGYNPFKENFTRFFSSNTPKIYITAVDLPPNEDSSRVYYTSKFKHLINDLETHNYRQEDWSLSLPKEDAKNEKELIKLSGRFDFYYQPNGNILSEKIFGPKQVNFLRRTQIFAVFIFDFKQIDFAIIQIGIALTMVKQVIILAQKETLSEMVQILYRNPDLKSNITIEMMDDMSDIQAVKKHFLKHLLFS